MDKQICRIKRETGLRLILQASVRHGKSYLTSRGTPTWFLNNNPEKRVVVGTYAHDFSKMWGRFVRNDILGAEDLLRVRINPSVTAEDNWETTAGGGMITLGVGGGFTGRGCDLLIIDDPIKNIEEATSQVYRDKTWDWFLTTAYTRLEPGGHCIITMARWHEDDLVGRLIAQDRARVQQGLAPEWTVITLPAIAEDNDQMGRLPGEALWPGRYSVADLLKIKVTVGSYGWSALFQQRPSPAEGGKFQRQWFRYFTIDNIGTVSLYDADGKVRRFTRGVCWRFLTADLALTTKQTSDYSVIQAWIVTPQNDLLLIDQWRDRREAPDVKPMLWSMLRKHDAQFGGIEKAHYGIAMIQELKREGYPVRELIADRDKVSRALLASVRMENGKIFFLREAPWLPDLESELLSFPNGTHDDQADCVAYAPIAVRGDNGMMDEPTRIDGASAFGRMNEIFG